eukprot:TRINITY_DN5726_c0_g6_i1.p1 TRINITY_DN5726_c0_g6~~TRINITY_DN5726_c0_g6_i1.p1  ORF type:complete len:291 (+),score=75.29 TRINITY_DN5726_c0_g6_i1:147-1019(+)
MTMTGALGRFAAVLHAAVTLRECTIFNGVFDVVLQGILGVAAFGALALKWHLERPQRRFLVFWFDASKQGGGFLIAHVMNMLVSVYLEGSDVSACEWYFVSIFLDCTVQAALTLWLLREVTGWLQRCGWDPDCELAVGLYGRPPSWRRWRKQAALWYFLVFAVKVVFCCLVVVLSGPLGWLAAFVLQPLEQYSRAHGHQLELVLVMAVWPLVLDVVQLVVQDMWLKGDPADAAGYRCSAPGALPQFTAVACCGGTLDMGGSRAGPESPSEHTALLRRQEAASEAAAAPAE